MKTWRVVSRDGRNKYISARTESEAYQTAYEFCGDDGILEFSEV
jgi:hypothetical protein